MVMDKMNGEPGMPFEVPSFTEAAGGEGRHLEKAPPDHHETAPSKVPASPTRVAPSINPVPVIPTAPLSVPTLPQAPSAATQPVITASLSARDSNHIEKEWVDATKMVVSETRNDPHRQKQEISRIKTDYQMKRFDKHPSTDEAVAA